MRRSLTVVAVASAAAFTGGCGGADAADTDPVPASATTSSPIAAAALPAGAVANITNPGTVVTVRDEPALTGHVKATLPGRTRYGTPLALAVNTQMPGWLNVTLPVRPNGATGWVPSGQFRLAATTTRIDIDLSDRVMTVTVAGKTHRGPVAVGAAQWPTPVTGRVDAYVTDTLRLDRPGGAYGSHALGLSLHSAVLTEFGGGDGQVGIHGTNDPASIGKAVSHGCVRVGDDLVRMLGEVQLGARVHIQP